MNERTTHALFIVPAYISLFLGLLIASGCGIYTTSDPLKPPFYQTISSTSLNFSGFNEESYFQGYVLWYKENEDETYLPCGYKGSMPFPTIPRGADQNYVYQVDNTADTEDPRITYTVYIQDLYPQDEQKSFSALYDEEKRSFYFAVSSYGINGEESEKINFGRWPPFAEHVTARY